MTGATSTGQTSAGFPAFGGEAVIAVTDPAALAAALTSARATVAAFDHACSRFRDDSELVELNRRAGTPVPVSPVLLEAIGAALRAAELTDGDVDPTVGAAMLSLGYDRDFDAITAGRPVSVVAVPGWRTVQLDEVAATVTVRRGGELDLGATAKALAADRAAAEAQAGRDHGVLVSFGGDIAMAGPAPDGGWRIRVTDDHRGGIDAPGQWIALGSGGLATSSATVRRWRTATGTAHHLVDPRTGAPATLQWRTVSVAAGSCLEANVASTAAIIRGVEALPWLESMSLPSRLVTIDGAVTHVAGWPAEGDDLSETG
jgi:thiamine biosynthesis lipoprotein